MNVAFICDRSRNMEAGYMDTIIYIILYFLVVRADLSDKYAFPILLVRFNQSVTTDTT